MGGGGGGAVILKKKQIVFRIFGRGWGDTWVFRSGRGDARYSGSTGTPSPLFKMEL